MKQEIEIEFKNLLTKEEFQLLAHSFSLTESFISQTNYYFDTEDFLLKANGVALRIRQKKEIYTLTLKQPQQVGILETHQTLSEEEATAIISNQTEITGFIAAVIEKMGILPSLLTYLGNLKTDRAEIPYNDGLLVLDHSHYFSCHDYELEYEVTDEHVGKQHFDTLLEKYNIPLRQTDNKIKRFFSTKEKNVK